MSEEPNDGTFYQKQLLRRQTLTEADLEFEQNYFRSKLKLHNRALHGFGTQHTRGRWLACGETHGLAIARLRKASGQWRLDRRLIRPGVK